jgi:hypothetical protein
MGLWLWLSCGWWPARRLPQPARQGALSRDRPPPWPSRWSMTLTGAGVISIRAPSDPDLLAQSIPIARVPSERRLHHSLPLHYRRLAITDEASPFALRSTRNRLRSHGRWPPRRMRMATPGQARLSLVRASPCLRLMRGPSRHHELFAASTRFSIVSSVGPAGRHQHRRSGRRWQAVELIVERAAGLDVGKDEVGPASASLTLLVRVGVGDAAARRSAPTRRSPRAWRRWPIGCRPRASPRW